jgi:hypothetical protein
MCNAPPFTTTFIDIFVDSYTVTKLKRETVRENAQPPKKRGYGRWMVLASTLALSAFNLDCPRHLPPEREPAKMRCYDYGGKTLMVYVQNETNGKELGKEVSLDFPQLGIQDGEEPLAYFCTSSGHLFWVTNDSVYVRRISLEDDQLRVEKVLNASHIKPDEYAEPGVKVISADIWRNPGESWENITVATLTNTGLFQAARYSLEALASGNLDRAIFDLASRLKEENRWPEEGVSGGVVRVLDNEMFVAIPLGKRGQGSVRSFYNIIFEGERGKPFTDRTMGISTMKLWKNNPELKNLIGISSSVRYDRSLGGWVVNLTGENQSGKLFQMLPLLTPVE